MEPPVPEGLVQNAGEWFYDEFAHSTGVPALGLDEKSESNTIVLPPTEEKRRILDLFKN